MHQKQQRAQQWQQKTENHPVKQQQEKQLESEQQYQNEVHTFLAWEAPGRPFKKRGREFFINGFLIMMAVQIILFLFSEYILMMVVFSLVFLAFALSSVPPRHFHYKISSQGVLIDKSFFIWEELYDFYLFKHHGQETIHITTKAYFPGELTLTLGDLDSEDIKEILLHYLPFREHVEPTWLEKAGDWLDRNFPLERSAR